MSDTPKTDFRVFDADLVSAVFARELERELAQEKAGTASLFAEKQSLEDLSASLGERVLELEHFLDGERIARQYAIDKGCELQRENFNMKEAGWRVAKALECACGHGYHGGGPALAEWAAYFPKSDSPLPNV